jgi:hypothetical protein
MATLISVVVKVGVVSVTEIKGEGVAFAGVCSYPNVAVGNRVSVAEVVGSQAINKPITQIEIRYLKKLLNIFIPINISSKLIIRVLHRFSK